MKGYWLSSALLLACSAAPTARSKVPLTGPACQANQQDLIAFVEKLPAKALIAPLHVELPECAVGEVPGGGALLEISERAMQAHGPSRLGVRSAAAPGFSRRALD